SSPPSWRSHSARSLCGEASIKRAFNQV
ncbi:hypothetical protein EE612_052272, partial [Oryza sativa]